MSTIVGRVLLKTLIACVVVVTLGIAKTVDKINAPTRMYADFKCAVVSSAVAVSVHSSILHDGGVK